MRNHLTAMRAKANKVSFTTRYVLLFGILLILANTLLGVVILSQSKTAMRSLINKNMIDVVKSAAGSLDGDALGALTEDDVDGPVFNEVKERLTVFQDSVEIEFIYAVRQEGEGRYTFTVDPDPEEPAAFGEEIVVTPALIQAGKGIPTADDKPAADRWGNFYSAYCPVFDSAGKVAGIVGVDFDASWYDQQVRKHSLSIAVVTSITVLVGVLIVSQMTHRVRVKFQELDTELSALSDNVDLLMGEMASYSGLDPAEAGGTQPTGGPRQAEDSDELEKLGYKIRNMRTEMGLYLEYLRTQAYTDALTKVGNTAAYHEAVRNIDQQIADGTADFCVGVFDINSLKQLNDTYGHECGDYYIQASAQAIAQVFGESRTFRVGGDEFAVIAIALDPEQMDTRLAEVTAAVDSFNASEKPYPATLAISQGASHFEPGQDTAFKDVFARADSIMYDNKKLYYQTIGNRRRRRTDD